MSDPVGQSADAGCTAVGELGDAVRRKIGDDEEPTRDAEKDSKSGESRFPDDSRH